MIDICCALFCESWRYWISFWQFFVTFLGWLSDPLNGQVTPTYGINRSNHLDDIPSVHAKLEKKTLGAPNVKFSLCDAFLSRTQKWPSLKVMKLWKLWWNFSFVQKPRRQQNTREKDFFTNQIILSNIVIFALRLPRCANNISSDVHKCNSSVMSPQRSQPTNA